MSLLKHACCRELLNDMKSRFVKKTPSQPDKAPSAAAPAVSPEGAPARPAAPVHKAAPAARTAQQQAASPPLEPVSAKGHHRLEQLSPGADGNAPSSTPAQRATAEGTGPQGRTKEERHVRIGGGHVPRSSKEAPLRSVLPVDPAAGCVRSL